MPNKTESEMIQEIHRALFEVPADSIKGKRMNEIHTEPKNTYTRLFAIAAAIHLFVYSFTENPQQMFVVADLCIIALWQAGSNGRATIVDGIRAWVSK